MKAIFSFLFSSILSIVLIGQKRYDVKYLVEGKIRESIIVKPGKTPPPGGYPVVFMLHGTSGDGEKFYNISGWKELGEEENFITVFPSSLTWCFVEDGIEKKLTRWVNGNVTENPCSGPAQNYVNDVFFLKFLAKMIQDSFTTNPSKYFICGFSNGCSMSHKMAIEAGDIFAAAAGTSSVLSTSDSANPLRRIPVWTMVGTLDDRFLVPPYSELPYGEDSILEYLHNPIYRVLGTQGLTETFVKFETPNMHTYQFTENQAGQKSKPYIFSLVKDMIHEFPNGLNHPVNGPRLFWNFFKQSATLATLDHSGLHPNADFTIFPNPAQGQTKIQLINSRESFTWYLIDAFGRCMKYGIQTNGEELVFSRDGLNSGIYIFKVQIGNKVNYKKVIFE